MVWRGMVSLLCGVRGAAPWRGMPAAWRGVGCAGRALVGMGVRGVAREACGVAWHGTCRQGIGGHEVAWRALLSTVRTGHDFEADSPLTIATPRATTPVTNGAIPTSCTSGDICRTDRASCSKTASLSHALSVANEAGSCTNPLLSLPDLLLTYLKHPAACSRVLAPRFNPIHMHVQRSIRAAREVRRKSRSTAHPTESLLCSAHPCNRSSPG